jgi:hypothetical protein
MEATLPRNGTHAAATHLMFPVVLAGVDFRGAVEGVAPSGVGEDVGESKKIFI